MRTYVVENGDVFIGTTEHWQNVFFDNADHENIVDFCEEMNWKLEWTDEFNWPKKEA
jgi:hypothetical protein